MNPALWFHDHGIRVFPIKLRDKEPACKSWDDYSATRQTIEGFVNYGVALGRLAVADSDSPESEAWTAANLPDTPFKVTTGRGRHRYYRLNGNAPHFFHRAGHTIEFRHVGQYVVGPGSIHKSGIVYVSDAWSWNILDVPSFPAATFLWDDRPVEQRGSTEGGTPLVLPPIIKAGERHDLLFKLMRSLQARGVEDVDVLLRVLRAENKIKCSPPVDDRELERYVRRVAKYKDRAGFERDDQDEKTIAGGLLIDVGLSVEAARELVAEAEPAPSYVGTSRKGLADEVEQPKQPFFRTKEDYPKASEGVSSLDSIQTSEPEKTVPKIDTKPTSKGESLACCMCLHGWPQRREAPPKRCPNCRSLRWNVEKVITVDEDDGLETLDLDEGDEDIEVINLDDDEAIEIVDLNADDEDVETIDEDE